MAGHSIDDYERKRDFGRTPEPAPGCPRSREGPPTFVVHRHDASSLHFDLRLEMGGVLCSWAVPRGLSWNPADKRLAVRTEDHPIEYLEFEGVIPKGQYGAGTMTIQDRGTYEITGGYDETGAEEGKLEFFLRGRHFRGEWHLVKTRGEKGNEWLLFKANDRFAREASTVAAGNFAAARPGAAPASFRVMKPSSGHAPFSDPEWIFEAEFEGLRTSVRLDGGDVSLRVGRRRRLAEALPELVRELSTLRVDRAVLDGLLVATDDEGRPSRALLEERLVIGGGGVQLYLFDMPFWEEWDVRRVPLLERKARLRSLVGDGSRVLFLDHVSARGEDLVRSVAGAGLGGVIAKRADSRYRAGVSDDWRRFDSKSEDVASGHVLETLGMTKDLHVEGVEFSNLDKVLWPEEGITKGDFVRYHDRIADWLLPYLEGRPLHLRRMPDGIGGEAFYQRRVPEHAPSWLHTVELESNEGRLDRHLLCEDRRTLLYLANLASIDLHPWMSRAQTPESPDWVVLDLDPKDAPFGDVVKVARAIGKILAAIDVIGLPKTSGKTGLHVFIPLAAGYTFEQGRGFCEAIARLVVRDHPSIATIERNPARRGGRVYVDFLQNGRGQTVVPPYTVRPVPGARVSAPLTWDELDSDLDPDAFTIETMPDRIARAGDLFRPLLETDQDLLPAIEMLQAWAQRR